ncbi:extracellular solute-binding protein [Pelagibacterium halotolerans]|uniref:extracellular solute-binding protein n=1 Tax=Pelagibacterium halotolerans TaxID=531813 RepID=UPI003850095B
MSTRDKRPTSLRRGLLVRMTAVFAVLLVIIAVLLWNYSRGAANRTYDLLLAGAALSILETVSSSDREITVDLPHSALDILSLAPDDRVFYAVTSDGGLLTGQEDLPRPPTEASTEPKFFDETFGDTRLRGAAQSRRISTPEGRRWVTVHVAHTTLARDYHALSLFILGLGGVGLVSVIGLGFVWVAIRTALQPLARIQGDLDARDPTDLTYLDIAPPREVAGLVSAINGFMHRLDHARRQSEAFMADVAHQTRTGLSALHGHLSMASDAEDLATMRRRLLRAEDQASRTTRLTNQLLSHAMVIHRAENQTMSNVDLQPLVRGLLSEMLRDTVFRTINVEFDDAGLAGAAAEIRGDQISLREALRNVIENARRHGPPENTIIVRLATKGDSVVVEVEDEGPGLSPELRAVALERFKSLNDDTKGSGLGLAIVKEVADAHHGAVALSSGAKGGLLVRLTFPKAKPKPGGGTGKARRGLTSSAAALLVLLLVLVLPDEGRAEVGVLDIWSATDSEFMLPVVDDFKRRNPGFTVNYREFETSDLYAAMMDPDGEAPDVAVSSAMDLQVDLVNRGLALPLDMPESAWTSPWSVWRSELFGFTFEPSAVVYHRPSFAPDALPRTHADMAVFLRENENRFFGRVGTYDIRTSGAGYLLATQDAQLNPQFFRIAETLGRAGVRVFCCTTEVTSKAADGRLLLGLNVIGSYALAAAQENPDLGVHFYEDFNPVMLRSAFVPRTADDPDLGSRFVHYLLSPEGQRAIAEESGLLPIDPAYLPLSPAREVPSISQDTGRFVPIRLSVGLLTYLDRMKRESFLSNWETAIQDPAAGGR